MLRFSTFAQHNFNDDARHHHHHHRHHHRQQQRVTTMIKKSGGNSYYRASPILKMSASDNNITSDLIESMRVNIREQLEAESVEVMDLSGNGRHVAIKVVSEKFEGKSAVNRQRMVYKAIWMELQDQVHAVNEMVTNTPEEEKKENP
jgi:stress-induced morphogen